VGSVLAKQKVLKIPAPLRAVARLLEHGRRFIWRFTGAPPGVHAIALTPAGKVILVKLNYARGWRAPGGGMKQGESPEEAIRRELQEEIGITNFESLERLQAALPEAEHQNIFLVRGVKYRAEPSLEIRSVREFELNELPDDLKPHWWRPLMLLAKSRVQKST